jgi:hypothetical protein
MTKYLVINSACDGRHLSLYKTLEKARERVLSMVGGQERPFNVGQPYYSDWGNRLTIEERPDGWTLSLEQRASAAFDAFECGTATKKQVELLKAVGWHR